MKSLKLNKKLMTEWIHALESGYYYQGRNKLYNSSFGTYCCLGVLRNIEPRINRAEVGDDLLDEASVEAELGCKLPQRKLAKMNDTGCTFRDIAMYLRNTYEIMN